MHKDAQDAQWTETNEKSIFRLTFFELTNSSKSWLILSKKMIISQKLKIA